MHLLELIDAACADNDSLEDGELPPSGYAIAALKEVIRDAASLTKTEIQQGDIATFFGEVSVTWRSGNKMLRLSSLSNVDVAPCLYFGTTPEGELGHINLDPHATGAKLAEKLSWLSDETY